MKKKFSYALLALVSVSLLLYGAGVFAASPSSSDAINGTLKAIAADHASLTITTAQGEQTVSLADSVWVYRNEAKADLSMLKPGDRVDVVLNNKAQAAYIKAQSAQYTAPAPQTAMPTPSPKPAPTATAPASSPLPGKQAPAMGGEQFAGIDLRINGPHFKLVIHQVPGNGQTQYELNLKAEHGGVVHLKGQEAADWIGLLLNPLDLQAPDARQKLLAEFASQYGLDAGKLHVQMKMDGMAVKHEAEKTKKAKLKDDTEKNGSSDAAGTAEPNGTSADIGLQGTLLQGIHLKADTGYKMQRYENRQNHEKHPKDGKKDD